ncbi:MAG TPA: hypothetical protein VLX09_05155 [Stellaceae bacterium]|nr:hypothetical protein [Stellaceae bacterium]
MALGSVRILEAGVLKNAVISIAGDNASGSIVGTFRRAGDLLGSNHAPSASSLTAQMRMPRVTELEMRDELVGRVKIPPTILIAAFPDGRDWACALQPGAIRHHLPMPFSENEFACHRSAPQLGSNIA